MSHQRSAQLEAFATEGKEVFLEKQQQCLELMQQHEIAGLPRSRRTGGKAGKGGPPARGWTTYRYDRADGMVVQISVDEDNAAPIGTCGPPLGKGGGPPARGAKGKGGGPPARGAKGKGKGPPARGAKGKGKGPPARGAKGEGGSGKGEGGPPARGGTPAWFRDACVKLGSGSRTTIRDRIWMAPVGNICNQATESVSKALGVVADNVFAVRQAANIQREERKRMESEAAAAAAAAAGGRLVHLRPSELLGSQNNLWHTHFMLCRRNNCTTAQQWCASYPILLLPDAPAARCSCCPMRSWTRLIV